MKHCRSRPRLVILWNCATLAVTLLGCRTPQQVPRKGTAQRPPAASLTTTSAGTTAFSSPTSSADAPSTAGTRSPLVSALALGDVDDLTEELRSRRVFRQVVLGNMPIRARESWLLSESGSSLIITCEADPEDGPLESNTSDRPWYLEASAVFVATEPPPLAKTRVTQYRRERLVSIWPMPSECLVVGQGSSPPGHCPRVLPSSTCADIGDELTLTCSPARLPILSPSASVDATWTDNVGWSYGWKPSGRKTVAGLSCEVSIPHADSDPFTYYNDSKPTLFFADRRLSVERLVYAGGLHLVGFREAVLTPFDGALPAHLGDPAP